MANKTGIVLEGGACRGVFTAGVLDVMQERKMTFDYCIGVSAGAGNAMNFKSRQPGRVYRATTGDTGPSYCGIRTARKVGDMIDLDYLYDTMSYSGANPFDFATYYQNPMVCEYVVSCCETGEAAYFSENVYQKRLLEMIKASCAMPGLCRPRCIDGLHYLDGGVTDPMPVRRALSQGCDRVVLVMTKPAANLHPTNYSRMRPLMKRLYRKKYPQFYDALMYRLDRYFNQLEDILQLEQQGRVFVLRPRVCEIKTLEKDRHKMRTYYHHGRQIAKEQWTALENYLK